jgi:hypothetical protein
MSPVYAKRRDTTHKAIHDTFEALGCLVLDLDGVIDMLVKEPQSGRQELVDAKTARSKKGKYLRTASQDRLVADGWVIHFLKSSEDAEQLVRQWRRKGER